MGKLKAWLKKWWWMLLLGLAAIGCALFFLFRKKKTVDVAPTESFSSKARKKIVEAETDAIIARVKAEVESEKRLEELNKITEMDGGVERRKRLADFLDDNL